MACILMLSRTIAEPDLLIIYLTSSLIDVTKYNYDHAWRDIAKGVIEQRLRNMMSRAQPSGRKKRTNTNSNKYAEPSNTGYVRSTECQCGLGKHSWSTSETCCLRLPWVPAQALEPNSQLKS